MKMCTLPEAWSFKNNLFMEYYSQKCVGSVSNLFWKIKCVWILFSIQQRVFYKRPVIQRGFMQRLLVIALYHALVTFYRTCRTSVKMAKLFNVGVFCNGTDELDE